MTKLSLPALVIAASSFALHAVAAAAWDHCLDREKLAAALDGKLDYTVAPDAAAASAIGVPDGPSAAHNDSTYTSIVGRVSPP